VSGGVLDPGEKGDMKRQLQVQILSSAEGGRGRNIGGGKSESHRVKPIEYEGGDGGYSMLDIDGTKKGGKSCSNFGLNTRPRECGIGVKSCPNRTTPAILNARSFDVRLRKRKGCIFDSSPYPLPRRGERTSESACGTWFGGSISAL